MLAAEIKAVSAPGGGVRTDSIPAWKEIIEPAEPFLEAVSQRLAQEVQAFDPAIAPYADYALHGQGKQLRPALVALTANALGRVKDEHVTVAVIIEMVHLATLVHDDVIDEAGIRRGRPTVATNWGNEVAVLFGDCLFANALTLAASFPTPEICRAVAMSTNTVCSGEILQIQHRCDFRRTQRDYFKVLEMKTGELFALSCELSGCLSGAAPEVRKALHRFGLAFGTAYQVYDDCVDLFGCEAVAGKSLGTDLAKGKLTLPVLLLWERADAADRARVQEMVGSWPAGSAEVMAGLLAKYQTLEASLQRMGDYLGEARNSLEVLGVTNGRACLLALTDYLAGQSRALSSVPEHRL